MFRVFKMFNTIKSPNLLVIHSISRKETCFLQTSTSRFMNITERLPCVQAICVNGPGISILAAALESFGTLLTAQILHEAILFFSVAWNTISAEIITTLMKKWKRSEPLYYWSMQHASLKRELKMQFMIWYDKFLNKLANYVEKRRNVWRI